MLAIIVFLIFVTVLLIAQALIKTLFASQMRVQKRMESLEEVIPSYDTREDEMAESLSTRLFGPAIEGFGKFVLKLSPTSKRERLENLLRRAGNAEKGAIGKWYLNKLIFAVGLPIILGILFIVEGNGLLKSILQAALAGYFIQFLLNFLLKRKISRRKKEITNNLPDALDLITVSVEAGLSFDGAVDRVVRQMPNALSQELATSLKEMRMGKSRREALRALSIRCEVDDLTTLTGALVQADELGVPIGKVLRIQSAQMRERRRQRAREKAMKAPVKLLFPLIFFIFPTIFVILIGPAIIQMMDTFME